MWIKYGLFGEKNKITMDAKNKEKKKKITITRWDKRHG
jgi:hypothetical protein